MSRWPIAPVKWWNRMHRFGNLIVGDLPPEPLDVRVAARMGFTLGDKLVIRAMGPHQTYRLVSAVDSTESFDVDDITEAA
jgi:hypothetical protein